MLLRRWTPLASGARGEGGTSGGFECLLLGEEEECLLLEECRFTLAGSWSGLVGESNEAVREEEEP